MQECCHDSIEGWQAPILVCSSAPGLAPQGIFPSRWYNMLGADHGSAIDSLARCGSTPQMGIQGGLSSQSRLCSRPSRPYTLRSSRSIVDPPWVSLDTIILRWSHKWVAVTWSVNSEVAWRSRWLGSFLCQHVSIIVSLSDYSGLC